LEEQNLALLNEIIDILKDEKTSELLNYSQDVLKAYFDAYAGSKGVIDYTTFVKFHRDFEIFPTLCNRMTLHNSFYTLAFLNNRTEGKGYQKEPTLNLQLFVQALILCAFQSKGFGQNINLTERMIRFMKRMFQSRGVTIVKMKLGKTR